MVIGGSGNGEAISANKVKGARAVLVWNEDSPLGREHNNANVISLGAREHPVADAVRFVEVFLTTPFSEDPRHVRRLAMISAYERTGRVPGL